MADCAFNVEGATGGDFYFEAAPLTCGDIMGCLPPLPRKHHLGCGEGAVPLTAKAQVLSFLGIPRGSRECLDTGIVRCGRPLGLIQ